MPISSGAGGKPNSYFNPANALSRRASVASVGYNSGLGGGGGSPGYYYGGYGGEPMTAAGGGAAMMAATPRGVQVMDMSGPGMRVQQNGQAMVTRDAPSRRCCPCPNRGRPEMRMPTMPKSKLATAGGAVSRRGCCIFLLGLLALATVAGLVAGLYFLGTQISGIRMAREAFYLIPGRRAGDLMWVIYGTTQECEPVTTSTSSTTSTTTTAATTTVDVNSTVATTTPTTTVATTTGTTLISCASTTFRYEQVTLAGWRGAGPPASCPAMAGLLVLLHAVLRLAVGRAGWHGRAIPAAFF